MVPTCTRGWDNGTRLVSSNPSASADRFSHSGGWRLSSDCHNTHNRSTDKSSRYNFCVVHSCWGFSRPPPRTWHVRYRLGSDSCSYSLRDQCGIQIWLSNNVCFYVVPFIWGSPSALQPLIRASDTPRAALMLPLSSISERWSWNDGLQVFHCVLLSS